MELDGETAFSFGVDNGKDRGEISFFGQTFEGGKVGFSFETKYGEVKYGLDVAPGKQATDYYGDWQTPSEYRVINGLENLLSKLDFYDGIAFNALNLGKNPVTKDTLVKIGPEVTFSGREAYSDLLFSDMYAALDNLLDNQKKWENQRHDYIADEAKRFGLDRRCFSTGELISLTKKVYSKKLQSGVSIEEPFRRFKNMAGKRSKDLNGPL